MTLARILLGPLAFSHQRPVRVVVLVTLVILLTLVTQIGGLVLWLSFAVPLEIRLRGPFMDNRHTRLDRRVLGPSHLIVTFVVSYAIATVFLVPLAAPWLGRLALPCFASDDIPLRADTLMTCALNRQYVETEVHSALIDASQTMYQRAPESDVRFLDANFPFWDGFPMLPHLSHDDGRSVDLAFFYRDGSTSAPVTPPSPIGYWVYESPGPGEVQPCAGKAGLLRWDFDFLQSLGYVSEIDVEATRNLIEVLLATKGPVKVGKVFVEPHLKTRLGLTDRRVRFQGCAAARHDDHIHVQYQ